MTARVLTYNRLSLGEYPIYGGLCLQESRPESQRKVCIVHQKKFEERQNTTIQATRAEMQFYRMLHIATSYYRQSQRATRVPT